METSARIQDVKSLLEEEPSPTPPGPPPGPPPVPPSGPGPGPRRWGPRRVVVVAEPTVVVVAARPVTQARAALAKAQTAVESIDANLGTTVSGSSDAALKKRLKRLGELRSTVLQGLKDMEKVVQEIDASQ